jgi:hypothetical protein
MYGYTYGYPSGGGAGAVNGFESAVLSDGGTVVAIGNTTDLYSRLLGLGLINSASLVNSCNGGKADALYNFVPSPVQALDRFVVTRASTKLRIGSNGLYGSVANNVPAFEFNTNGTYRGLLVEPGATNLILRSQEFNDASWILQDITVTANASVSPDGATTGDKIIEAATTGTHIIAQSANLTIQNYTYSLFAKQGERQYLCMAASNVGAFSATFDLSAGTVIGSISAVSASIEDVGNGWYKCVVVKNVTSAGSSAFRIGTGNSATVATVGLVQSYTGDGTSGLFIWQAQLETGSVATSPIVTTAGTASRVADVVSLTGASSLIGATEGTLYAEVVPRNYTAGANRRILNIRVDGNNVISLEAETTIRRYSFSVTNGGVQQVGIISGDIMTDTIKLSGAYKVDDFAFYINGSQIGTDTSGTVPNVTTGTIGLGIRGDGSAGTEFNGWIRSVALFPTRLSNAQLVTLTT